MTVPGSPRRAAMPGSDRGWAGRWARIRGLVALAGGIGLSASASLAGDAVPGGPTRVPSAEAPRGGAPGVAVRSFSPAYWSRWRHGPPADPNWFPLGVFDNDPYHNDAAVKAAGLTLYVGLYDFGSQYRHYVTDGLVRHASSAMAGEAADVDQVVADPVGGRRLWGYQPADEPEMKHYNVPDIRAAYDAIRAKDATRPIFMGSARGCRCRDRRRTTSCRDTSRGNTARSRT